jgi:hypothetical protein
MASQSSALSINDNNFDIEMKMEVTSQALSMSPSSPRAPLLASSQSSSVPSQRSEPDYSLWTAQKYALWPGFTTFHDSVAEKNPWWQFGYRMRDERTTPKKIYWICCQCFKRNRPLTRDYTYNASTWKGVERHMKRLHRVEVS